MATINVVFDGAILCDVTNPGVTVHASYPKDERKAHLDGEFRTYAAGRVRIITTATDTRTHPITLQWLTPAQVALLDGWRGRLLLLRTDDGRRVFGSFLDCDPEYVLANGVRCAILPLVFTELTYDESV
jgi:hypothetical protein